MTTHTTTPALVEVEDFYQYQALAFRTVPEDQTDEQHIIHGIMGMCGEAGEIFEIHGADPSLYIGELGDTMWYAALCATGLRASFRQVMDKAASPGCVDTGLEEKRDALLIIYGARLMEIAKKHAYNKRLMDLDEVYSFLVGYCRGILNYCQAYSTDPLYVGRVNITKLKTRYPEGFYTDEASLNRDYVAETAATGHEIK